MEVDAVLGADARVSSEAAKLLSFFAHRRGLEKRQRAAAVANACCGLPAGGGGGEPPTKKTRRQSAPPFSAEPRWLSWQGRTPAAAAAGPPAPRHQSATAQAALEGHAGGLLGPGGAAPGATRQEQEFLRDVASVLGRPADGDLARRRLDALRATLAGDMPRRLRAEVEKMVAKTLSDALNRIPPSADDPPNPEDAAVFDQLATVLLLVPAALRGRDRSPAASTAVLACFALAVCPVGDPKRESSWEVRRLAAAAFTCLAVETGPDGGGSAEEGGGTDVFTPAALPLELLLPPDASSAPPLESADCRRQAIGRCLQQYGVLRLVACWGRAAAAHAAGAVGRFAAEALPALVERACSDVDCSCCVARLRGVLLEIAHTLAQSDHPAAPELLDALGCGVVEVGSDFAMYEHAAAPVEHQDAELDVTYRYAAPRPRAVHDASPALFGSDSGDDDGAAPAPVVKKNRALRFSSHIPGLARMT
ncbi:hypothetical protein DIPPA_25230 [Diplonema papillatum]|nr:hypothetical protein DIPPA_25230 [Diplonema papillatum]